MAHDDIDKEKLFCIIIEQFIENCYSDYNERAVSKEVFVVLARHFLEYGYTVGYSQSSVESLRFSDNQIKTAELEMINRINKLGG